MKVKAPANTKMREATVQSIDHMVGQDSNVTKLIVILDMIQDFDLIPRSHLLMTSELSGKEEVGLGNGETLKISTSDLKVKGLVEVWTTPLPKSYGKKRVQAIGVEQKDREISIWVVGTLTVLLLILYSAYKLRIKHWTFLLHTQFAVMLHLMGK